MGISNQKQRVSLAPPLRGGSFKAIQLYCNLRRASALMTLETASISPKLAQDILTQAAN